MSYSSVDKSKSVAVSSAAVVGLLSKLAQLNNAGRGDSLTRQAQLAVVRDVVLAQNESDRGEVAPLLVDGGTSAQRLRACMDLVRWLRVSTDYWTYEVIADHLNSHGQVARRGGQWTKSSVRYAANTGGDPR